MKATQKNTKSEPSSDDKIRIEVVEELLDLLDKARNLEDLITSLKAQKAIIETLLVFLE